MHFRGVQLLSASHTNKCNQTSPRVHINYPARHPAPNATTTSQPPTPLMLPSPWKPRVAALMSESPPRTLVQAPGQVMQAAAGHVLTPRHKMAAHFAPRALLAACVLFFLLLPLDSKDEEEAPSPPVEFWHPSWLLGLTRAPSGVAWFPSWHQATELFFLY